MRLPAVQLAPAFWAGALLAYFCDIPLRAVLLVISAAIAAAVFIRSREFRLVGIGLFAGAALMSGYIAFAVQPVYALDGMCAELSCRVVKSEYVGSDTTHCVVTFMYGGREHRASMFIPQQAGVGDEISALVRLSANEGSYNFSRNILLNANPIEVYEVRDAGLSPDRVLSEYRSGLINKLRAGLDEDIGSLAAGMMFGDKQGFSAELARNIRNSGVMHLMVVSGLHFMLCMTVLLFALRGTYPIIRASVALLIIPLVAVFFGDSPSVIRAAILLAVSQAGVLMSRRVFLMNTLCAAMLAMTVFTPYAALDCGLMMSFLGVFGAGILAPEFTRTIIRRFRIRNTIVRAIVGAAVVSLCATTCTAPVSVLLYEGISVVGVPATVFIMPFFTLAMVFGVLFAASGGISALVLPIGLLMKPISAIIGFFGEIDGAWLTLDFLLAGFIAATAAVGLTLAGIAPMRFRRNGLTLFAACALTLVAVGGTVSADRRCIAFVSDGKSGAAVICMGREAAVLISGTGAGLDDEIADTLAKYGILRLRTVIAQDADYMGAVSVKKLCRIYERGICEVCIPPEFAEYAECKSAEIITDSINHIEVFGLTIATDKSGGDMTADIVMYSGYKKSVPQTNAQLPIYVSSRQKLLPENGVNISGESYVYVPQT